MAEIKNTFLKSKMNKDLDNRLLPNGEYRDAQNISVGKSEDADVGALENIIGNALTTTVLPYDSTCEIIGYYVDKINNRVITFVTNYTDPDPSNPSYVYNENNYNSGNYECHICVFNQNTNSYIKIVTGDFLNLSTTNKVLGVNIIEQMLFWTDNRNQPRKISLDKAIEAISEGYQYYNSESQISVAKYNPYAPIDLVKKITYKTDASATNSDTISFSAPIEGVKQGMIVVAINEDKTAAIEGSDFVTVDTVQDVLPYNVTLKTQGSSGLVPASVTVSDNATIIFLESTMSNQESDASWPGDPDLLEDKYVRFSYRFKFDDGEYSLMAPFTQIAYVPKQKGYFYNGDEDASFRSTIVEFMENEINNIELLIPLPSKGSDLKNEYKISAIDILYKESDALSTKVLETIPVNSLSGEESNIYSYEYQSRKPYKTLAEFETTRVYDKVPVRAFAQETSGNRVMYANFYDQYTPPNNINYFVGVSDKNTTKSTSFVEYPNHQVKQNRNYQVGFVLADKFGRQSPVILSPVNSKGQDSDGFKGGSTLYHAYNTTSNQGVIRNWFGDQMQVVVYETSNGLGIDSSRNLSKGTPGLYAVRVQDSSFSGIGFSINFGSFDSPNQDQYEFTLDSTTNPNNGSIPRVGDYLRGEYKDYVKVTAISLAAGTYTLDADGSINSSYLHDSSIDNDIKFAYTINQTGWYSYKVVVKQTEQEYYNCYLPGILNGYPDPDTGTPAYPSEDNLTAHIVLLNDNINKIPRDLSEVGPDQKQYRSSVRLFGRVSNDSGTTNEQYYPGRNTDTASTIATATDLNMGASDITSDNNFYQLDTNPLIARISTLSGAIGVTNGTMLPVLAVYETEPVSSLLDIFWETSTAGLISDLNEDVSIGSTAAVGVTAPNFEYNENQDPDGVGTLTGDETSPWITDAFIPIDAEGTPLNVTGLLSDAYLVDGLAPPTIQVLTNNEPQTDISSSFVLYQEIDPLESDYRKYRVRISGQSSEIDNLSYWGNTSLADNQYTFILNTYKGGGTDEIEYISLSLSSEGELLKLTNIEPFQFTGVTPTPVSQTAPLITINKENETNKIIVTGRTLSNGAKWEFTPTNWNNDVGVFLTSVPATPISEISYSISIHNTQSSFQLGYQWDVGYYDVEYVVKDAMETIPSGYNTVTSQGTRPVGNGGLDSATYSQEIRVIPGTIPAGLQTTCLSTYDASSPDSRQFNAGSSSLTNKRFAWYVAESTLSSSDYAQTSSAYTSTPVRLGSTGFSDTAGEMQLDLMVETQWNGVVHSGFNPGGVAIYEWKVWYRPNSSSQWSDSNVFDSNGSNLSQFVNGVSKKIETSVGDNIGGDPYKSSSNIPLAFTSSGEYFIECYIKTKEDASDNDTTEYGACWVNVNDANYPSCIPCGGVNLSSGSGRDTDWFNYDLGITTGSDFITACEESTGPTTVYARTPYAHIVREFFSDTTLETMPVVTAGYRNYIYETASSTYGNVIENKFSGYINNMTQTDKTDNSSDSNGYRNRKGYITGTKVSCETLKYNANTNVPNLDGLTAPDSSISEGTQYTVSAAGDFYTQAVDIGDTLTANTQINSGDGSISKWDIWTGANGYENNLLFLNYNNY